MYQPTTEQAEKDRLAAYEAGVPHGKAIKSGLQTGSCGKSF